jgi:hypothetical protein
MSATWGGKEHTLNKIAVEFVRYVLEQNPKADNFVAIYDAMSRTACARSFHNLGHEELAMAGVSFSLLDTNKLEELIAQAQRLMVSK